MHIVIVFDSIIQGRDSMPTGCHFAVAMNAKSDALEWIDRRRGFGWLRAIRLLVGGCDGAGDVVSIGIGLGLQYVSWKNLIGDRQTDEVWDDNEAPLEESLILTHGGMNECLWFVSMYQ